MNVTILVISSISIVTPSTCRPNRPGAKAKKSRHPSRQASPGVEGSKRYIDSHAECMHGAPPCQGGTALLRSAGVGSRENT